MVEKLGNFLQKSNTCVGETAYKIQFNIVPQTKNDILSIRTGKEQLAIFSETPGKYSLDISKQDNPFQRRIDGTFS